MVSSRDRKFVSVEVTEVTARTPPPAFLFPNQRCQRPKPPERPHRLTPGGRRRRRFSRRRFRSQPAVSSFFCGYRSEDRSTQKRSLGPPRGCPVRSSDSIEARKICSSGGKSKSLSAPVLRVAARLRARRRYTSRLFRTQAPNDSFGEFSRRATLGLSAADIGLHALGLEGRLCDP